MECLLSQDIWDLMDSRLCQALEVSIILIPAIVPQDVPPPLAAFELGKWIHY